MVPLQSIFHTSWFPETGSGHLKHCVGRRCKCYCLFQHSDPPPEIDQWHARPADLWPIGRGQQQVVHVQQQYGHTNWAGRQMSRKRYSPLWSSAFSREFSCGFWHSRRFVVTHAHKAKEQLKTSPWTAPQISWFEVIYSLDSKKVLDYKVWE